VRVVEFSNIPSDYMGPDRWPGLTKKVEEVWQTPASSRCVITHGTDTLDQTATSRPDPQRATAGGAVGAQRNAADWTRMAHAPPDAVRQSWQRAPRGGA
jgi:L-asparaginase